MPDALYTLSLVTDRIVIVQPSEDNLHTWAYDPDKFAKLVDHGVFLPIFPEGDQNPFSSGIKRADLLSDQDFFASYEMAIQHDLEDDEFFSIAEQLRFDPKDLAYNVNWDLILSQVLNCSLLSTSSLQPVWQHKFRTSIRDLTGVATLPPEAQNAHILTSFLHKVLDDLPSSLTADQLLEFRNDQRSANFRTWFRRELEKTAKSPRPSNDSVDDAIFRDFKQLARQFSHKSRKVSATITTLSGLAASVISASIGNVPGAIVGSGVSLAPYAFQKILQHVWKTRGPNNWIFVLLDFHSSSQL